MNALELFKLASKIMLEAPVLLPDVLKIMNDQQQVFVDFQKLVTDFQGIKDGTVIPSPVAPIATAPTVAS